MTTKEFWSWVKKSDGCWIWQGSKTVKGYGTARKAVKNGRHCHQVACRAHRRAWELYYQREIPRGKNVLHKCDNPSCCNPNHLFLGTNRDNVRDALEKGRMSPLLPKDVRRLRRLREKKKLTYDELAKEFGCSPRTVSNILNGHTWGWLK